MKKMLTLATCLALFLGIGAPVAKAEESVTVQIIVIALGNAPVKDAAVTIGDREDTTKNNGSCVFTLPPGDYTVCAKGEWGGMSGQKCQDVTLKGSNRFVVLELFQKPSTVW
ncbi:MAG TPA: hypothetical protein ACFYD3_10840 [Candidatus Hypogeohydataceae bacterium YC41]